jgi:hypothetical protein
MQMMTKASECAKMTTTLCSIDLTCLVPSFTLKSMSLALVRNKLRKKEFISLLLFDIAAGCVDLSVSDSFA